LAAAKCGFEVATEEAESWQIPAPILTRWWAVGECAAYLLEYRQIILVVCHGVIQANTTDEAVNQIASGLQACINTPKIESDIHLIHAYHKYFLCSHFAWLQKGDSQLGNKPGFLNRHIAVRYFLMLQELSAAYEGQGWKALDAFKNFRESMEPLDEATKVKQTKKCNFFLMITRKALKKHLKIWVNDMLFLSVFGEAPTCPATTRYFYPTQNNITAAVATPDEIDIFDSPIQNRRIYISKFKTFLTKHSKKREAILRCPHVFPQRLAIQNFVNSRFDVCGKTALLLYCIVLKITIWRALVPSLPILMEPSQQSRSQIKGRGDNLTSTFSNTRTGMVETVNSDAHTYFKKQTTIPGNKTVTGGKYGGRKRKKDGLDYVEKTHKM
jgi:hypothetical protein